MVKGRTNGVSPAAVRSPTFYECAPLYLASHGRFGQDGDAGTVLDRLLDVLDVVELGRDLYIGVMPPEKPVNLPAHG